LDQITANAVGKITALVLDVQPFVLESHPMKKVKLWIPDWKRLLSWTPGVELPTTVQPGSKLLLAYFANPSARQWKEKIVFRLEDLMN
jgi:hypothetical protein